MRTTLLARCVACHHEADVSDARDIPMCPKCFSPMVVIKASSK